MTAANRAAAGIEVTPDLAEHLVSLTKAIRSISHGPLSELDDAGPVSPMGLEALSMSVDRHGEVVGRGLSEVASALSDVADGIRNQGVVTEDPWGDRR